MFDSLGAIVVVVILIARYPDLGSAIISGSLAFFYILFSNSQLKVMAKTRSQRQKACHLVPRAQPKFTERIRVSAGSVFLGPGWQKGTDDMG
jgi:hypothetical protein